MKRILLSAAIAPLLIGGLSVNANAQENGLNIFNNIKVKGELRPRYESAEVKDNNIDKANAFTMRTKLSVSAELFEIENLTATVGITSVNNFGYTKYNSSNNGQTQYDKIVDPQQAMISNASLDYKTGKTALHAGRSAVNLDNQRFIGTVGWRQMDRAYDTAYIANNSVENLNLLLAYVYGFQGVKEQAEAIDTKSILLHAKYKVMDELTVTAYDYMLASIHDTMGIALTGNINAGAKLNYRLEYAVQGDATMEYAGVAAKADATYLNVDLGVNANGILAGINYEVLSGVSGGTTTAFSTPLATGHKFNGWADMFLGTPTGGLKDANIRLGYKAKGFGKLLAVYHDFKAETSMSAKVGTTDNLGSEIDAVYVNKVPGVNGLTGLLKFASYSKGDVTSIANATFDKQVAWVQLDYKF